MGSGGSDEETPRRHKHRRSPELDGDSIEPSKRRKHRHRHKHHRKHKHDVTKPLDDVAHIPGDDVVHIPGDDVAKRDDDVAKMGDDVEEGEIIEEGEIVEDGVIMEIDSAHGEVGDKSIVPLDDDGKDSEDKMVKNRSLANAGKTRDKGDLSYGNSSNGDVGLGLLKENYSVSKESESPVKSRHEGSDNDHSVDSKSRRKPLSPQDEDRDTANLQTRGRYHDEVPSRRSRSHSRGRGRERSQSVSISGKGSPMKTTHMKDESRSRDAKKASKDSEDERMAVRNWDSRHGYRDGMRDSDRERSYSRYGQLDRHQSREPRDSERGRSRDSWDRDRFGRGVDSSLEDIDRQRDKERASSRDSKRQTDREWERDRERARVRDRDSERERTREREERELEREREWRKERELQRGRDVGRNRSRDRESDRDRERDRDGERRRSRSRNRERDRDDDMINKSRNYEKNDSYNYEDRNMYKNSRPSRDEETDYKTLVRKNDNEKSRREEEEEQEEYQEKVAFQLVDQEDDDVDRIKEESRRRRQAILEKYKLQQQQQQQQLHKPELENDDKEHVGKVSEEVVATNAIPETLAVRKEADSTVGDKSIIVSKSPPQNGVSASARTSGAGGLGEGTPKSERSGDMFCDDIFGDSPAEVRKTGRGDGLAIERGGLHDNWDDAEGYYSFRFGEILDGRYEVTAAHGKGVFSTVVRAKDLKAGVGDPEEVAIKIIRNNEHMHKAGKEELIILKKLVGADPEDRRHCVRFLSSFKYRNHLCLVFESLNMNLREVLKKFGRNIGLKLTAVRSYSKQLFIALKHLRNCGVLHSDIKPDNMLVNEAKNVLKLCDFGNAMFAGKNEITPYLVSRFYRAPEIILGLPYDHPLDIWSVGCCIFELYSGKVLFPGATNNDMLRLHMELKGPFPKKMLRKGAFTDQHFDQDLNFLATEEDPVTKKAMRRLITSIKPKDIGAIVTGSSGEDPKMLANFKDLLEKIFILDPDKRLTVSQALSHPFITGK